ncbi:MAG: ATP phosphoribosyltransferase [Methanosarcina mazei]|uniref:ATP phosphoribosyltransferase n=2 Tax=Methanosarcina mazei TaxID=2209 RepID=HIS1_METMA|nr:ATP phosphoribosyltransferase [Methanosarcina mazei]Q8PWS3.1 RecName: Full=ATP phosphoribosyltransferase; Short=ATP-PRT; Short=ATP-PRTase [Methanosarcina mazei Go1]AAM31199.1 ATP phosphoribosyltransferase [Methanosarcina mazei Go1]AKB63017.1 ATP phosphoribosyltransferase [Methanosarcina mazei SarPi]TAH74743.1 MAG: ATP phosphoribosyltransferase [Methanosarcina mazei]WIM44710.1 ATP phosphoribosyltransferase [Methanosarcina mazei]WIM48169.1 ATP phosphoribosyltransferase [Methanosarcina mazei]
MIRIAIPNKGRLYEPTISIFKDAGLPISGGAESRKLFAKTTDPDIHILFARAADIPEYVQDGAADVGITGMDLITERGANVEALLDLKFGRANLVLAVPEDSDFEKAQDLEGKKVATEFPEITRRYFEKLGVNVNVIKVSGACEMTPHVGIADAIVDISSSGTTLLINHLKAIDMAFSSTVYLIANKESLRTKEKILDIKTAFESVLNAKKKRYLMMNVPESSLKAVKEVLPGMSGPTVMKVESSKFSEESILAVHAVVDADLIFTIVNRLKKVGARDVLVVPIERIMP